MIIARRIFFIFCYAMSAVMAVPFHIKEVTPIYEDIETNELWNSLTNLYDPTAEDYQKIQHYLKYGRRPYLDTMFEHGIARGLLLPEYLDRSHVWCNRLLQRINFTNQRVQKPIFNTRLLGGATPNDKSRCIILYASCNADTVHVESPYYEKLFTVIKDLKAEGYKGHVLYRIGGYPLLDKGGIRFAHIPYSFKVLFLIEASLLGYDQVLWIDTSIHPTNDLNTVFSQIEKKGIYLLNNGTNLKSDYNSGIIPDSTIASCDISLNNLSNIPHIVAGLIGISFKSSIGHAFINEWYRLTSLVCPAISLYPEEFLVSVASWRVNCRAMGNIEHYIANHSAIKKKPHNTKKPFWFDKG